MRPAPTKSPRGTYQQVSRDVSPRCSFDANLCDAVFTHAYDENRQVTSMVDVPMGNAPGGNPPRIQLSNYLTYSYAIVRRSEIRTPYLNQITYPPLRNE